MGKLFKFFMALIGIQRAFASYGDLDQQELIMPRHMMEQFIEGLSFPELVKLESVNKGLLNLCSHAVQYRLLTNDWNPPAFSQNQYDVSNPRKKFMHMLKHMPQFQLKVAELWQLNFPLRLLAPQNIELPRDYYWPQALNTQTKSRIKNLYNGVLDRVKTHYCPERARAVLGLSTLESLQMGVFVYEIVDARKFNLTLNEEGSLRKTSVPAYEIPLRMRALVHYIPFYSPNHLETLLKLTAAKYRVFPINGQEHEDFHMELARIGFCCLLGEMLFKSQGDHNLILSLQHFNEVVQSRLLSRDLYNHIGLRTLQIQFKEHQIQGADYYEGLTRLLGDPYTSEEDFQEIEQISQMAS